MGPSDEIRPLQERDADALAGLYVAGIPNAIFCALGRRFIRRFFWKLSARPEVVALAGVRGEEVLGVVVGTLNRPLSYGTVLRQHRWSLLAAAGCRLLSPRVLLWVLRSAVERLRRRPRFEPPDAELLLISVRPEARGTGLARRLVEGMESRFVEMGFTGTYTILTEAGNEPAGRLYQKIGATLKRQVRLRGRLINVYGKAIGPSGAE